MGAPAILKIDIIADATKAQSAMKKTGDASTSTGSKIKALGQAVATGFAVTKIVEFGKASVTAAYEANREHAKLTQVFKSMGDSTGEAAKAAMNYAGSLSKKIGVDDEAIMKGQTLLATFSNVNNETARAAGIFDRATAAGADLAAAGFGSIESNAVLLGKALQDPVKGMAALRRVGVTLTQQQQDQVKAFAASGKTMEAQKIILGAVETQVGGTAAATATGADKMKVAMGNAQEAIGNALIPVLEALAPILEQVAQFIEKNISWLMPLAIVVGILAVAWNIASIAATLFGVSMAAALWPVLLVIAAIAALIAIGVLIVKNWDTIKAAAAAVWSFMVAAWNAILNAIRAAWNWIKSNWPLLLGILTGPIGLAIALIIRYWSQVQAALVAVWNWIRSAWGAITAILTAPFRAAWSAIQGVLSAMLGFIRGIPGTIASILSGLTNIILAPFNRARDLVGGIASGIAGIFKAPLNAVIGAWNSLSFTVPAVKVSILGHDIGAGPWTFSVPRIPPLAEGGTVLRTGLALVHAGEQYSGVGNTFGGTTIINVSVTTTGLGADSPEIQRAVVRALRGHTTRNGPLDIPVRSA